MRIVLLVDWFSEGMGYSENCLPKALAALGHEVHVVTTDGQVYFTSPMYATTYQPYLGAAIVPCGTKLVDGYALHRLPHGRRPGQILIRGLAGWLRRLRPEVVQTFDVETPAARTAALLQPWCGYRLFHECHLHESVLRGAARGGASLRQRWGRCVTGILARRAEACYAISPDTARVAVQRQGFPADKVRMAPLGVDTDILRPAETVELRAERERMRGELGLADDETVCIYTGRLTEDKGPAVLAGAIAELRGAGERFRGLFVGGGPAAAVAAIAGCAGCEVRPFVPYAALAPYYRAADVGVWPKQESTSQLDAMASGLPVVLSDKVQVRERWEGNGLTYREGEVEDLARVLRRLGTEAVRRPLGAAGVEKARAKFSWRKLAEQRMADYAAAVRGRQVATQAA